MQRLLRVSMATGRCGYEPLPDYLRGLGGRGLASAMVARATDAAEPWALEAMLVFAPGLLAGTHCANAGRMSVCFKSPVTGLLHEANAGGMAGAHMARLGIAGLILEGRTANNTFLQLEITRDSVRLTPASVQGLGTRDAATVLANRHGARCSCILIGTAGEMGLPASGIAFTDRRQHPARHAGSGGGGAVMGALGLKAVVITPPENDDQPMRDAAAFSRAARGFAKVLMTYHGSIPGQGGAGECAQCIAGCPAPSSRKKGKSGKWPGYETLWRLHGSTADDDNTLVARFGELCDDAGVDAFETARGLEALLRAGKLERGDARKALELVAEIGRGTPTGRLLGSGSCAVAVACGLAMPDGTPWQRETVKSPMEDRANEATVDTLGVCRFAAGVMEASPDAREALEAMLDARYGTQAANGWLDGLGQRVLALEDAFNARVMRKGKR